MNAEAKATQSMAPLFIPLKTEHYDAFECGAKKAELRVYGPRWNERTCVRGRLVTLSKGYGKQHRLNGVIGAFHKRNARTFSIRRQAAVLAIFGSLDKPMAEIDVRLIEPPRRNGR